MLSTKTGYGFVCLSCRRIGLPASRHRCPSLSALCCSSSSPKRNYSHGPGKAPRSEATKRAGEDENLFRRVVSGGPRFQPEVYHSRGHSLRPREENLSVDILGRPAHAIIMRDIGESRSAHQIPQAPEEPRPEPLNLVDALERQVISPTLEEILQNIHELRPSHSRPIPQKEFDSLKDDLIHGLTGVQLAAYISNFQIEEPSIEAPPDPSPTATPWVLEQWPWVPYALPGSKVSDPSLIGYVHKSMSSKEQLAVRLMRECWGVSTQEVEKGPGHLDVRLRDLEFELLLGT